MKPTLSPPVLQTDVFLPVGLDKVPSDALLGLIVLMPSYLAVLIVSLFKFS